MSTGVRARLTDECLAAILETALKIGRLQIVRRRKVRSFHHHLECVDARCLEPAREPRLVELFVRTYGGRISWSDVTRVDLPEREWAAWSVAGRAGLPLPRTYWSGWTDGRAMAVQERLPHRTLWDYCTPEMIDQSARALVGIHGAAVTRADQVHLADARVPALLERLAEWSAETGDDLSRRAVHRLRAQFADIEERPPAFLHGDVHPANFLADGREVMAIIDWEEASVGDPRLDIACMDTYLRWFWPFDLWFQRRRMERLAVRFVDRYREFTGWDPGPLHFWKGLVDTRTVVVAEWVQHRARKGLPFPATNSRAWASLARAVRRRVEPWAKVT